MEDLVSHHNSENERLIREITQLRTRLIQKAETIGSMQYQTHNKVFKGTQTPLLFSLKQAEGSWLEF